jgi:hypothetical protein
MLCLVKQKKEIVMPQVLFMDFAIKHLEAEIFTSFEKEAQGQTVKTGIDCPIMLHEYVLSGLSYERKVISCDCPTARNILHKIDKNTKCRFNRSCPVRVFINEKQ